MLSATIRSVEKLEIEASADTVSEARRLVLDQVPDGFVLTDALPIMAKGGASVTVKGKAQSTAMREVEAPDMASLEALVEPGWQLLSVLRH